MAKKWSIRVRNSVLKCTAMLKANYVILSRLGFSLENLVSKNNENLKKCYDCREGFNQRGRRSNQTYFDENCYELNGEEHLTECALYYDHCETNLITDWFSRKGFL